MSQPRPLLEFAQRTIQACSASVLPWSSAPRSIQQYYVELRVADSTGRQFPARELLHQGDRLILVGDPGSGKTTALKQFAVQLSEDFLGGRSDLLPVFIQLREAFPSPDALLRSAISLSDSDLAGQHILLLLDGLDEVPTTARIGALGEISRLGSQYPQAQIVLASRPAGLSPPPPENFRFYHLESLDSAQVLEFVAGLAADKAQVEAFQTSLSNSTFLEGLSRSPLLIQLIWHVYQSNSRLPEARAELYRMASDLLLYNWDAVRNISRHRIGLTVEQLQDLLSTIALEALTKSLYQMPVASLRRHILASLGASEKSHESIDAMVAQLLSSGLLIEVNNGAVSFPHLSFMEFYAARQLATMPRKLASMLAEASPHTREVTLFAAGMVSDVAPLVEAAVDRRELVLAASCLREGLTENKTLEAYVLDQLRRELGNELVGKLAANSSNPTYVATESIHSQLLQLFERSRSLAEPAHKRGKLFETFAERFFRQCFDIVGLNVNTENGEIDIVLGNIAIDPFWAEWGGDILVECKNWNENRPLKEVATFAHKVKMSRGKLGFFVSMRGFTEDAIRTLKNQVADRDAPLVVPLSGDEIEVMLNNREKFDPFFRRIIRNFKHLNKW